ncbi:hypothetical protein ACQ4PT_025579 [Festuca glaucescens]
MALLCSTTSCSSGRSRQLLAAAASPSCSCCDQMKRDDIISYSFPSFNRSAGAALAVLKDASINGGSLQLTPDTRNNVAYLINKSGSVLLLDPVTLWRVDSHGVRHEASFNTTFDMNIFRDPAEEQHGEGLTFVIASSLNGPPQGSHGGFLGLTNTISKSNSSSFVAVEFDTAKQSYDPDDNHVGLNIGSVDSAYVVQLSSVPPGNLTIAPTIPTNYTVWIEYNGVGHHIWVYMAPQGQEKPGRAVLDAPLNMSSHLPQRAYIGFSGSTGQGFELNIILSWSLTLDKLPGDDGEKWKVILPAVLGTVAATAAMIAAAAFYFSARYKALKVELKLSEALRRLPGTPREFKYVTIRKATDNFDEARKLGKGGFGAVYKGTLRSGSGTTRSRVDVAVKKFTRNEERCYDDFLAEVDVINRLRHRNIVPLIGWCYQKGELLLIYEYMPNGSLDQHLFRTRENPQQPATLLGWNTRYDIIMDVTAGLHYVHHEHEHMVLHRDVKASNIMLDSSFRGRLGDFGLARIVTCLDKNSYTDIGVAGTWGFIAPEYSMSHKATRKTDIYALGVLILEVVTGKRALGGSNESFQLLTDWVWTAHREGRLLEAVDDDVAGEFDEDDASRLLLLGLACTNPNPSDRPSMAEVVQIVAKSATPPDVPLVKPTFVWPPEGGWIPLESDDTAAIMNIQWEEDESLSSDDALEMT